MKSVRTSHNFGSLDLWKLLKWLGGLAYWRMEVLKNKNEHIRFIDKVENM